MDAPVTSRRRSDRMNMPAASPAMQAPRGGSCHGLRTPVLLFVLALGGCGQHNADATAAGVSAKARELLAGVDARRIQASALTDFNWDTLCFERGERLRLAFQHGAAKKTALTFDYDDLFVDEPYVAGSLADRCIKPADEIVLRKKYPGHGGAVELAAVRAGADVQ